MSDLNKYRDLEAYRKAFPNSEKKFVEARKYIPAGVNSTARATWSGWEPFPLYVSEGKGSRVRDVDGHEFVDYLLGLGPMLLGHRPDEVTKAVTDHINNVGTVYALASDLDTEVAKKMTECVPSLESVRLNNSGTEAVIYALRLARTYTGRKKVIRFEGMYHGFGDTIYWSKHPSDEAMKDGMPIPEAQGPGVPEALGETLIILPWNDPEILEKTIKENYQDIAAVITEPIMCNTGCILPKEGYLEKIRKLTEDYGIVMIMDEVITGFRISLAGAQGYYNIKPDLSIFAKAMGGGYPVASLGGKKEIMDCIDRGDVSVAGTYSGNGIALAATSATLDYLRTPNLYENLYKKCDRLKEGLDRMWRASKVPAFYVGIGPVGQVWFSEHPITNYREAKKYARGDIFALWWQEMLMRGVLFHPHYYENLFTSMAHTDEDIDLTLAKAEEAIAAVEKKLGL
ncbi:MAG: aspartate aminotransferase family protein [Parasporobacterium sp.]|nr:aspartate aminotransferase family protein [Parasporobacterium sp.]